MVTNFRQNRSDKENKYVVRLQYNGTFQALKKEQNKTKQKPNNMWYLKTRPSSHLTFFPPQRKPLQKKMGSLLTAGIEPTMKN